MYVGVGGLQPSTYCKNSIASKKERRGVEKEEEEVEMEEEKETSLPVKKNLTPANVATELRTASYCTICLEYYLKEQLLVRLDASLSTLLLCVCVCSWIRDDRDAHLAHCAKQRLWCRQCAMCSASVVLSYLWLLG